MASFLLRWDFESRELVTLMEGTFRAARRNDNVRLLGGLNRLRERVRDPVLLGLALRRSELSELTQLCFSDADVNVRKAALSVFLSGLYGLGNRESSDDVLETISIVLRAIQAEVLNVAVRSDLFLDAFEGLSVWCSKGKVHRDAFLEVFPIEQLMHYDIFHYPSDVLRSYCGLVRNILSKGISSSPLFGPVLKIYQKILSCAGNECYYPQILSGSIREALKEFESEDPTEEVINSSFIDSLVRHAMTQGTCKGYCASAIMELIAECLASYNKDCQRLIDQGILNLIGICLTGNCSLVYKHTCSALATVFVGSYDNIGSALRNNLVGPLFTLRDSIEADVKEAARNALLIFFARATSKQIFTLFEQGHCRRIVKLLDSIETSVQFDGLRWLFALVSATRAHAPHELSELHKEMLELDVKETCERLKDHDATKVGSLAHGLLNLMGTHFKDEV